MTLCVGARVSAAAGGGTDDSRLSALLRRGARDLRLDIARILQRDRRPGAEKACLAQNHRAAGFIASAMSKLAATATFSDSIRP